VGKKSQKFHLGLDLANFFHIFFLRKIGQENLLNHSFMLCFLVLGKKNSQDKKFRHDKEKLKIKKWNLHLLFLENV
jgi:hypothetical protein